MINKEKKKNHGDNTVKFLNQLYDVRSFNILQLDMHVSLEREFFIPKGYIWNSECGLLRQKQC